MDGRGVVVWVSNSFASSLLSFRDIEDKATYNF